MATSTVIDLFAKVRPKAIADARDLYESGASVNDVTLFLVKRGVPVQYEQVRRWCKTLEAQ